MNIFCLDIVLLIILFLGNKLISNSNYYFSLIYIFLTLYHIYISIVLIRKKAIKKFEFNNFIIPAFLVYFISYYLFCDPNPFSALIFYYIFYPNFIKGIIIILIHTYFLSTFYSQKNAFVTKSNEEFPFMLESKLKYNFYYFLSPTIKYLKKKKKLCRIFLMSFCVLLFLNILLFENRIKIWVLFYQKNKTLPISYSSNRTFYITSNIVNVEDIIEMYIEELKNLIEYLGNNNVIISIVENGDSVDNTGKYLKEFQSYLNEKKILNQFILSREIKDIRKTKKPFYKGSRLRIEFYAKLRNKCFDYLYQLPNINFDNTIIIYLNDVIFRYEDIINLLSTNNEDFDLVCGLDMMDDYFYDRWVSIDLDGNGLKKYFPFFINKEAQDLILNHKPIRVFSCWNGVNAFKASSLKNKQLQFRHKINYTLPRYILNNPNKNYYESECTYFNIDLFSLGFVKKFINPDVRVVYNHKDYFKAKYFIPSRLDFAYSIILYFMGVFRRRNKLMSNYKSKEIKLNNILKKWYFENSNISNS